MRRVSLFNRAGNFEAYVTVRGSPRVITWQGRFYVAFDVSHPTNSFREVDAEAGT